MAKKYDDSNDAQERSTCKSVTDDKDESFDEPLKRPVTRFNRSSNLITFDVHIFGKAQHCQTSGNQTVKDMLIENIPRHKLRKLNTDNLIFKRISDDCAINLGLPTGSLDNNDKYECNCTEKEGNKQYGSLRKYNVQNFVKEWDMGFFYIKIDKKRSTQPAFGDIKNEAEKVQISFLPRETLYEAIVRDGRLQINKKWYFKLGIVKVPLGNRASDISYKNEIFKVHYHRDLNDSFPDNVQDLPEPSGTGTEKALKKGDEVVVKQELNVPLPVSSNDSDVKSSTPDLKLMPTKLMFNCDKDLWDFLENQFGIAEKQVTTKNQKEQRSSKIKKLFGRNYINFVVKKEQARSVSKTREVIKMSDSVGAVVFELHSGVEYFKATCFVIGCKYVITNHHVIHSISETDGFKDFFVDFDYENGCQGYKFRFDHDPFVSSPVLDYAILKLREPGMELPPSLTKCGYIIPCNNRYVSEGEWLTLVGFPQHAGKKLLEDLCPLKHFENLDPNMVLSLGRHEDSLRDTRRQTYETSAFFHGSSGSPGVLMNEKLLIVLHCRGFFLQDGVNSVIEQGVRMSAIRDDVKNQILSLNIDTTIDELFDMRSTEEDMEIDSNNDLDSDLEI